MDSVAITEVEGMAALIFFTLAIFAGSVSSITRDTRIIGGYPTTVQEFPAIVQVEFFNTWSGPWTQSCAANILNSVYMLSAAHCFDGPDFHVSIRRIRAGATFRHTEGQVSGVWMAFNHPDYGNLGFDADISVVRIMIPLHFSPVVQPTAIIGYGFNMPDNSPVVHVGWGSSWESGPHSPFLQKTTIYTINREECARRYLNSTSPGTVTENNICAGVLDVGGKGACDGDAGGPMYFQDILVGVISWSYRCAKTELPGVSTAVSPYTPWIIATIDAFQKLINSSAKI